MVLIASLLLLVVVTLLALSMFRSFGVQGQIAGNVREKQRALSAAESAQQYAEYWLSSGYGSAGTACSAGSMSATSGTFVGKVCSNAPSNVTSVPWSFGVTYTPPGFTVLGTSASTANSYYALPSFYITYLGPAIGGQQGSVYQIDALGYGGTPNAVAVVESTYLVTNGVKNLGAL